MKFSRAILSLHVLSAIGPFVYGQEEKDGMTKMCLFYPNESGHARSDPILNQECASDHVHTFYGKLSKYYYLHQFQHVVFLYNFVFDQVLKIFIQTPLTRTFGIPRQYTAHRHGLRINRSIGTLQFIK